MRLAFGECYAVDFERRRTIEPFTLRRHLGRLAHAVHTAEACFAQLALDGRKCALKWINKSTHAWGTSRKWFFIVSSDSHHRRLVNCVRDNLIVQCTNHQISIHMCDEYFYQYYQLLLMRMRNEKRKWKINAKLIRRTQFSPDHEPLATMRNAPQTTKRPAAQVESTTKIIYLH